MRSLFGLAPGGVCRAGLLPDSRCALTAPFHPCHAFRRTVRRYLSVALSVGSRRPGVTWHRALWSPDFPRHSRRSDATVWPTPPWAFYGFGDEYPRIRLRGCRTGTRSDPSSASPRESGKAEHRAFGGPPCPGGGAHPSGRHPVFTRVVAHPCATCAPPPGHGVLGRRQGRSFVTPERKDHAAAWIDMSGAATWKLPKTWRAEGDCGSGHGWPRRRVGTGMCRRDGRNPPRVATAPSEANHTCAVAVTALRLLMRDRRRRLNRPSPHHRAPCAARR